MVHPATGNPDDSAGPMADADVNVRSLATILTARGVSVPIGFAFQPLATSVTGTPSLLLTLQLPPLTSIDQSFNQHSLTSVSPDQQWPDIDKCNDIWVPRSRPGSERSSITFCDSLWTLLHCQSAGCSNGRTISVFETDH